MHIRVLHKKGIVEMAVLHANTQIAGADVEKRHEPEGAPVTQKMFQDDVVVPDDVVDPGLTP